MGWNPRWLAMLFGASTLVVAAAPAVDAQQAAPAPAGSAAPATGLASRVTELTNQLAQLEAQGATLQNDLTSAEEHVQALTNQVNGTREVSSVLVAAARKQALAAYVFADPASQAFTLASAVTQGDANDLAWSLGLLRVAQSGTRDLLRRASAAGGTADQELVDAIGVRDRIALELSRTQPAIESTKNDLKLAELALDAFVVRLGPSTIAGMTTVAFEAYRRAAATVAVEQPACGIRWELLAAIGKTESNHGAGRIDTAGNTTPPIVGIPIGGDTDGGALDLDPTKDHAVGPMQFIPSTWRPLGADGNGDGVQDPNNYWDATLAAARYLCRAAGALTLNTREGVVKAILAYNPNQEYLRVVGGRYEALARDVASGWFSTADLPVPDAPYVLPTGPPEDRPPTAPPDAPPPPPPATEVRPVTIVTGTGLAVGTAGAPEPGVCLATSAALSGRAGFLRCQTTPAAGAAEALDPCQVAPFDPSLAACLPDPQAPARLLRLPAPLAFQGSTPGPPYFSLVLEGSDRCLPVGGPTTPLVGTVGASRLLQQEDPTSTVAEETTTTGATTTIVTTTTTAPPPTTAPPTTPPPTEPPTTPPSTEPPTTPPSTEPPTTTTTLPPYIPPVPAPAGASYQCASGAYVLGQPASSSATWTVTVFQPGIANRQVNVLLAFV